MKSQLPTYGAEICRVELPHNSDLRVEDQKPRGTCRFFRNDRGIAAGRGSRTPKTWRSADFESAVAALAIH
jgi:hypothetical protein